MEGFHGVSHILYACNNQEPCTQWQNMYERCMIMNKIKAIIIIMVNYIMKRQCRYPEEKSALANWTFCPPT